jgi:hypothetical protein
VTHVQTTDTGTIESIIIVKGFIFFESTPNSLDHVGILLTINGLEAVVCGTNDRHG